MERDARDTTGQTISWRYEQARKLGLAREDAAAFSRGDGDLGQLRRLIEQLACDPQTAARIVA